MTPPAVEIGLFFETNGMVGGKVLDECIKFGLRVVVSCKWFTENNQS